MQKKSIHIDSEKCIGCGACAAVCRGSAIVMRSGKAQLPVEALCDGLGNCLPVCPVNAISFEMHEPPLQNEATVKMDLKQEEVPALPCGCPGSNVRTIQRMAAVPRRDPLAHAPSSRLGQWPIQIRLVPEKALYFDNANLLVSADCAAYAYGNFHEEFMKNRITLIGCPKLDDSSYRDKLTAILASNNLRSVMVVRMEVPCCGGIVEAVRAALGNSGKIIPWQIKVISTEGHVLIE